MTDVHAPLSDRARDILRQADVQHTSKGQVPVPAADDHDEVLDILQEALDTVRGQLEAIRDMLDDIAGQRP